MLSLRGTKQPREIKGCDEGSYTKYCSCDLSSPTIICPPKNIVIMGNKFTLNKS